MRIHGNHSSDQIHNPRFLDARHASKAKREQVGQSRGVSSATTALTSQLAEIPDVRSDVVADVKARLHSGELLSPDAAARTADAILNLGR